MMKVKEYTFLKDNMLKTDEKSSEILVEVSKLVKSTKSESEKKKKEADKNQNQNEQGGGRNNSNYTYRENRRNHYQSNDHYPNQYQPNDYYQSNGAGRGMFNAPRNNCYPSAYYQQSPPHPYQQSYPAPQNLFPSRPQQYKSQYAPQGFMQPKVEGK
jgi:hypothetical protein